MLTPKRKVIHVNKRKRRKKKKVRRKKKENKLHRKERTKASLRVTLVAYLEFHPTVCIGTLQFTIILKQKEAHLECATSRHK